MKDRTETTTPNGKDRTVAQVINTTITSSKVFSPRTFLITAKTRQNYDPVLDEWVTEYQIPHDKVVFDDKSQNRDTGTPQARTSSLSHEMNTVGQKTGIKVEINDDDFLMRWGNTRYGGVDKLYTNVNGLDEQFCVVKNCDKGMIWASIWDGKSKDLCRMQARENNLHETSTPANVYDNLRSMKKIIDNGHLDYDGKDFDDCDDAEKEKRARKEVDTTMPFFGGKKFKSFWNKYKKKNKPGFQVESQDLKMLQSHFTSANPFGINSMSEAIAADSNGARYVFEVEHDILGNKLPAPERVKFIFPNNGTDKGAILQSAFSAKYVHKVADKVYGVVAVNPSQAKLLTKFRNDDIVVQMKWNDSISGSQTFIDGAFYVPQSAPERLASDHWAKVVKF